MAKRASIPEIGTAPPVPPVPPVPPAPEDEAGADAKLAGEVIDETGLKALFDQKIAEMNERIAQMSKVPAGDFVTRQEVAGFITADHVRQMIDETGLKALFDQKIAEMNERIAQMSKVPAGDFVTRQEVAGFITADHVRQMIEEKLAQLRREAAPDHSKMDNLPRVV